MNHFCLKVKIYERLLFMVKVVYCLRRERNLVFSFDHKTATKLSKVFIRIIKTFVDTKKEYNG